jgi:hypothetical protein
MKRQFIVLLLLGLAACGPKQETPVEQRVWSVEELRALKGQTREEVEKVLGRPTGLYTFYTKGRWHYPNVKVRDEGSVEPKKRAVIIYFSQFGEGRATIIDFVDKWENEKR